MIFRRRCLECDYVASEAVEDPAAGAGGRTAVRPDDAISTAEENAKDQDRQRIPVEPGTIERCSS
jgi:hypothetical protein